MKKCGCLGCYYEDKNKLTKEQLKKQKEINNYDEKFFKKLNTDNWNPKDLDSKKMEEHKQINEQILNNVIEQIKSNNEKFVNQINDDVVDAMQYAYPTPPKTTDNSYINKSTISFESCVHCGSKNYPVAYCEKCYQDLLNDIYEIDSKAKSVVMRYNHDVYSKKEVDNFINNLKTIITSNEYDDEKEKIYKIMNYIMSIECSHILEPDKIEYQMYNKKLYFK